MTRTTVAACILFTSFALSGCGSEAEAPVAGKNGNTARTAANAGPAINTVRPANSSAAPSVNANSGQDDPLTARVNKKGKSLQQPVSGPMPDIETLLKQSTRPAPENSEFAVALTDILVERRTFPKHPVLVKIEKTTDGEKRTIRVFTRDGRSTDLPDNAIGPLSTASTASILKAAGIESRPDGLSERKSKGDRKN